MAWITNSFDIVCVKMNWSAVQTRMGEVTCLSKMNFFFSIGISIMGATHFECRCRVWLAV